jgi:hypothetical protein
MEREMKTVATKTEEEIRIETLNTAYLAIVKATPDDDRRYGCNIALSVIDNLRDGKPTLVHANQIRELKDA